MKKAIVILRFTLIVINVLALIYGAIISRDVPIMIVNAVAILLLSRHDY